MVVAKRLEPAFVRGWDALFGIGYRECAGRFVTCWSETSCWLSKEARFFL